MRSNAARAGVLILLAAVAVALFIALSGSDDSDDESTTGGAETQVITATPAVETIEMADGAPVGGVRELVYEKGDRIRIVVELDEPQEDVHIHGYEEEVLNPAKEARFDFPAKLEGIYELEAHGPDGDVVLAEIRVNP